VLSSPRLLTGLIPLLVLLALVLPASALGAWEPAQQLPAQPNRELELGLDGRGDGVLAWTEYPRAGGVLYAARRAPAASFAAPQPVSALGQDVRGFALATMPQGPAALAWRAGRESDGQILVLLWRLGGAFPTARALTGVGVLPPASRAGTRIIENAVPAVATGSDGWALAAWLARGPKNCGYVVRAAVRAPGREFDRAARASGRCAHASRPDVAVADRGLGLVTWRQGQRLYGAVATGRRLGHARLLSAHPVSPGPALAATGDRIVAAWRRVSGPVMALEIRDGRVGRPRAVSRTSLVLDPLRVAASAGGAIAAAWQTTPDALAPVQFALSPAAGRPFSAPETVARRGVADGRVEALRIALDRGGDALVTWCGQPLGSNARPFGGSFLGRERIFAPVTGLTPDDPCAGGRDRVRLAVAQDTGEALLAWTRRPRLLVARRAGR
jgi:hypothetical protein